ncbi:MAG TPA: penicillin-binding protein 2, partial [Dehalococcoidia bacterium]|nr:penicillin-binding protein 2 [Dehalococcoidia bacterium]
MGLLGPERRRWRSARRREAVSPSAEIRMKLVGLRLLVLLLFAVLAAQLVRMQIIHGDEYRERAETNRLRVLTVTPPRGLIYDRNGTPLVENVPGFSAVIIPADLPEDRQADVIRDVAALLGADARTLALKVMAGRNSNDPFRPVVVRDGLSEQETFAVRERQAEWPGVQVVVEPVRKYPYGALLSHILGYVGRIDAEEYERFRHFGYQVDDRVGKTGVEYTYEADLRGVPGILQAEIDAMGRVVRTLGRRDPTPGGNLVLSLDLDLQRKVTEILQQAAGPYQAAAVVMNVHTGEILALVSLPSYDNNIFSGTVDEKTLQTLLEDPRKPLVNHAIAERYPPGSTFKQVTATAALQEGVATPSTTITSYGYISVPNQYDPSVTYIFRDWAALGTLDFYGGLAMSSDVYFYYLSGGYFQNGVEVFHGLGPERLAAYARAFGLGSPTGIDLPGESPGLVPDPAWKEATFGEPWVLGDTYNFGIGQGYLAVTPIQMARVTAAIANGGQVLRPHLLREVVDAEGRVIRRYEPVVDHVLPVDPANLAVVREAMRQAVVWGTAKTGAVANVAVAGKTGTAEFGERYADGSYLTHGWYTAFAPYDAPEISIAVFLERGGGAVDAGPVAAKILDYYFNRANVAE